MKLGVLPDPGIAVVQVDLMNVLVCNLGQYNKPFL